MTRSLVVGLAVLAVLSASGGRAADATAMPDLVRAYESDAGWVSSFYDLPWSEARFDRMERLYADWTQRLASVSFDALDAAGRVDHVLLRNELEQSLARIGRDRDRLKAMDRLIGFRRDIQTLEQARWRGETVHAREAASRVDAVGTMTKKLREAVEAGIKARGAKDDATKPSDTNGPPAAAAAGTNAVPVEAAPFIALRAAGAVADLRNALKRWYEFYSGYQPDFAWWVKTPYEEAAKQLEEYAKFLREEAGGQKGKDEDPLVGDPIGAAALAEAIRFEFLPQTADELIAIGDRELAWGEAEMKKAAREMGMGDDWKAALAKVKDEFVPPGQQDDLVGSVAREALAFVRGKAFATVPAGCEETWRIAMLSPEGLKTVPYAAYGGQEIMVAYAREDLRQDDKLMVMRGNNRHFTRLTTAHELIPGHHLQIYQAARNNTHRRVFSTPFYIEGWALYCELRLWDMGWARTPQERIGMLFWRMNRAARIVVTLRHHLGRMKPDEMVDFLIDRVGHERLGARSEVRRFVGEGFSPLYQAAYTLGGLQLRALHDEMVKPGGMTECAFNDAVLTAGPMPVELLRTLLRGPPPARDARPVWRFDRETSR